MVGGRGGIFKITFCFLFSFMEPWCQFILSEKSNFHLSRTVYEEEYRHKIGPHLLGLHPKGLFTFGLSPFELPMMSGLSPFGVFWTTRTCRLSPFGLLWCLEYRRLDYYDKRINNIQTLYLSISSFLGLFEPFYANLFIHLELPSFSAILGFLGLFKPLYKKIHCTVQNILNGYSDVV